MRGNKPPHTGFELEIAATASTVAASFWKRMRNGELADEADCDCRWDLVARHRRRCGAAGCSRSAAEPDEVAGQEHVWGRSQDGEGRNALRSGRGQCTADGARSRRVS